MAPRKTRNKIGADKFDRFSNKKDATFATDYDNNYFLFKDNI